MSLWRRISASTNLFPEGEQYVVVHSFISSTTDNDLNLIAYPFDSVNGFGDRLVPVEFIGDGTAPSGRIAFAPNGTGVATTAGAFIPEVGDFGLISYGWDEGFGSQNLSGVKARGIQNVAFHPDGDVVFTSHAENTSTSRVYAHSWSNTIGYAGTRSSTDNLGGARNYLVISVSPNGQFVAAGYDNSVNLAVFPFDKTTGFGAKVEPSSDPISDQDGTVFDITWNNAGTYIALSCGTNNPEKRLHIWEWNNATGTLGSKVANVSIEPDYVDGTTGTVYTAAFAPDDKAIIVGFAGSLRDEIQAYSWDNSTGTFGSKYPAPAAAPNGVPRDLRFNANGNVLFASGGSGADAPITAYQWDSETGFGIKYDNPDSTGTSGPGYNAYSIDYINLG